jgi:DNA-binding LacI/PurR family transcriptional regulator
MGSRSARTPAVTGDVRLGVIFAPTEASEAEVVDGIYPAAMRVGYEVLLTAFTPARDPNVALKELVGHPCHAVIVVGAHIDADSLRQVAEHVRVVWVGGGPATKDPCWDVVRSSGDLGVERVVDHLFELGHRRITYVHGPQMPSARSRYEGYLRAMNRLRLPAHRVMTPRDHVEESGADAAELLLSDTAPATAVVAGNDHAAVGLIRALLRAGVDVPEHVSVAGFDDSWIAQQSYIDLTAVHQDWATLGRVAVETAVERISGGRTEPTETVFTPTLVVRGSTAPPRRTVELPISG